MTKRVIVELLGIECRSVGSDDGAQLEIYGDLHAKRMYVNEYGDLMELHRETLWQRGEDSAIGLSERAKMGEGVKEITIQPGEFL